MKDQKEKEEAERKERMELARMQQEERLAQLQLDQSEAQQRAAVQQQQPLVANSTSFNGTVCAFSVYCRFLSCRSNPLLARPFAGLSNETNGPPSTAGKTKARPTPAKNKSKTTARTTS